MMPPPTTALVAVVLLLFNFLVTAAPTTNLKSQFGGDILLRDLFVSDPFQADPTSSYNGTLLVQMTDTDYPTLKPVHCHIEWQAGVGPPDSNHHQCENNTARVWFPENTFHGVKNFQLQFAHTVIEPSVGPCPNYCYLTKFAAINITFPETEGYSCDADNATCEQALNGTLRAMVYSAIA